MLVALGGAAAALALSPRQPPATAPPALLQPITLQPAARPPEDAPVRVPGTLSIGLNVPADIRVDGRLIVAEASSARIAFDGDGEHDLEVTARGYQPFRSRISVADGSRVEVPVTLVRGHRAPVARPKPERLTRDEGLYIVDPWR
jgi:hypothetical protein